MILYSYALVIHATYYTAKASMILYSYAARASVILYSYAARASVILHSYAARASVTLHSITTRTSLIQHYRASMILNEHSITIINFRNFFLKITDFRNRLCP